MSHYPCLIMMTLYSYQNTCLRAKLNVYTLQGRMGNGGHGFGDPLAKYIFVLIDSIE